MASPTAESVAAETALVPASSGADPAPVCVAGSPAGDGAQVAQLVPAMEHALAEDGSLVMVMAGIPGWSFGLSIGAVVLLSFVAVERIRPRSWAPRAINLTASPRIHRIVRHRFFQAAFQLPVLAIFLFTIYAGLVGNFAHNIAPVLVWTIWWAGLVFAVALLGNAFCFVCPWDALANLSSRLSFWRKTESLSLGLPWPRILQTVYPAIGLFIGMTWLELGWGITQDPRATATLGLAMAAVAASMALLFEKKAFCRSVCLVGRVSGMYANAAPVEIRPRDLRVCGVCRTRACQTGAGAGYPCPTGIDLGRTRMNTYCTQCTECFKSCPSLAPAFRIRVPGADLTRSAHVRMDEALLAVVLLALTAFHGLSMTSAWESFTPGSTGLVDWMRGSLGWSRMVAFTVGMAGVSTLPIGAYALASVVAWWLVRGRDIATPEGPRAVRVRDLFQRQALAVLPVALCYHLAHNAAHIFMEGQQLIPLLSDPLGTGADWFRTASWHLQPILSQEATWAIQVVLVVIGHLAAVLVSHRIAHDSFDDPSAALRSGLPYLVLMIALSVGGLWLMHLDMNMRIGRM